MAANLAQRIDSLIRAALLLLIAAAAVGSVLVMTKSRPEPVLLSPSALSSEAISLSQTESVPGGALVQAPLFWESRQPYVAPEDERAEEIVPETRTGIDDMRLVGIVGAGVQSSAAIVVFRGERLRIPFGEEQAGWRLSSMTPTTATFLGIDRSGEPIEHTLSLYWGPSQLSTTSEGTMGAQSQPDDSPSTWSTSDIETNVGTAEDPSSVRDPSDTQNNPDQNG